MDYTAMEQYWIWLSSVEGIGAKRLFGGRPEDALPGIVGQRLESTVGENLRGGKARRDLEAAARGDALGREFENLLVVLGTDEESVARNVGDALAVACVAQGVGIVVVSNELHGGDVARGEEGDAHLRPSVGLLFVADEGVAVVADVCDAAVVASRDAPPVHVVLFEYLCLLGLQSGCEKKHQ